MLYIYLYKENNNIFKLDTIKNSISNNIWINYIVPEPTKADSTRDKILNNNSLVALQKINIITIGEWLKDQLTNFFGEESLDQFLLKSELVLMLGMVWLENDLGDNFNDFMRVYSVFTDLRSYTLNEEILEELLDDYDEVVKKGVLEFSLFFRKKKLIDEHLSYYLLSESIHQISKNNEKSKLDEKLYIFGDFNHLTGAQIDFLHKLSLLKDVYITIPEKVFENCLPCDWPKWLKGEICREQTIDNSINLKKIEKKITAFHKSNFESALDSLVVQKEKVRSKFSIVLAKENPSFYDYSLLPYEGIYFKSNIDFLVGGGDNFIQGLKDKIISMNEANSILNENINDQIVFMEDVIDLLQKHLLETIKKKKYKELKFIHLFKDVCSNWIQITGKKSHVTSFVINLLAHVAKLNSPRVFATTILNNEKGEYVSVCGLNGAEVNIKDTDNILCILQKFCPLISYDQRYTNQVFKKLSILGPVRRTELDFLFLKEDLIKLVLDEKSSVLIEEGSLELDILWREVFEEVGQRHDISFINYSSLNSCTIKNRPFDLFKKRIKKNISINSVSLKDRISASKIQSFIDCKFSYYLKYKKNIRIQPALKSEIDFRELGILEHEIIRRYFQENDCLNDQTFNNLVSRLLTSFVKENKNIIKQDKMLCYEYELKSYSRNALVFLYQIKKELNIEKYSFHFEKKIEKVKNQNINFIAFPDLILEVQGSLIVLDFKRSQSSIPSFSEFINFKKVQLWFYQEILHKEVAAIGYICLSEIKESFITIFENNICEQSISTIFKDIKVYEVNQEKKYDLLKNYREFESEVLRQMYNLNENEYMANPRDINLCSYCSVRNFCEKNETLL